MNLIGFFREIWNSWCSAIILFSTSAIFSSVHVKRDAIFAMQITRGDASRKK